MDTFCPSQSDKSKQYQYFLLQEWCQYKTCTNSQLPTYIRSIKIFTLQFSIKCTINTNPVRHGLTKSTKSIFILKQVTNVKQIKTSIKIVQTQEFKIRKWCAQAKTDACHLSPRILFQFFYVSFVQSWRTLDIYQQH